MASDSVKSQSEETQTQLILLGTGTPNADPERSGPSLAIVVGSNSYIVDFGPGVVRRASALSKQWGGKIEALNANNLKLAFLTHLHSDHTAGYADLILTPWVLGRNIPLEVYGPKGLTQMTEDLLEAYRSDISYRLDGLEPANALGWQVNTHEITEGVVFQDDLIEVTAFKINHGSWDNAFGYRFVTPDKTIVISGDTRPSQNLIRYSEGADILVHEVYSQAGFDKKTEVWKKYHASHHTSTFELGEIAKKTKPGLLVLHHILFWGATEEELLDEISQIYDGLVSVGSDMMIY
ncbi:MAG TPA: MBL fold metallo-hydrolase [Gammaproteobacteria bacterium]|nr:MBL fold metallo-hydrolase [Gammaproteobacteria bacterium]HIG35511.1 MBL fold metallo-hydrolase [Gammaproteobacteria bacterium]HIK97693.1 MBL fold metallo-hydrolase [Gammaproteobacteria bacterium]